MQFQSLISKTNYDILLRTKVAKLPMIRGFAMMTGQFETFLT